MKKYTSVLLLFFLLFACKKDKPTDPCDVLVDGVYQDCNIPEEVLPCLETDGLLESCFNFSFISGYMLMAGCNGLQDGYDLVRRACNGFVELEKRPDAMDVLIAKYKSIDTIHYDINLNPLGYGGYNFYTYNLEAILAQEVFLKNATKTQKIELLSELIIKQDFREKREVFYFIEGPAYVMARLLYYDNYEPLIQEYNQNSLLRRLIIYGVSFEDIETRLTIISLANDYLNLLKTG